MEGLKIHLCHQQASGNSDRAEFVFSTEEQSGSDWYSSIEKPQAASYAVRMQSAFAAV